MQTIELSAEERIAALRSRVEEKKRREKEAEERAKLPAKVTRELRNQLTTALAGLSGLPLNPRGVCRFETDDRFLSDSAITKFEVIRVCFFESPKGEPPPDPEYELEILVHFDICHDGETGWIEHDGDRVSLDVAVDLAIAVVESRLDA